MSTIKIRKTWIVVSVFFLALIVLGCARVYGTALHSANEPPETSPKLTETAYPQAFTGQQQAPQRIIIPKIALDEAIHPVATDDDGRMSVLPFGVGWYKHFASPGWASNAILAAHNYYNGVPGTFEKLHILSIGDTVSFTYADESSAFFEVISIDVYPASDVPLTVMENKGITRTTLIVCDGEKTSSGEYSHRRVVILEARQRVAADGQPLWVHTF